MRFLSPQTGMSIIENLISVAIGAVVVLGSSAGTMRMIRSNGVSANLAIATAFAEEQVERLRADARAGVALTGGTDTPRTDFSRTWTVPDPDSPAPGSGLTSFRVRVSWSGYQAGSVSLHSVVLD